MGAPNQGPQLQTNQFPAPYRRLRSLKRCLTANENTFTLTSRQIRKRASGAALPATPATNETYARIRQQLAATHTFCQAIAEEFPGGLVPSKPMAEPLSTRLPLLESMIPNRRSKKDKRILKEGVNAYLDDQTTERELYTRLHKAFRQQRTYTAI